MEEYRQKLDIAMTDLDRDKIWQVFDEMVASFGGCSVCYGRGYITTIELPIIRMHKNDKLTPDFCACARGQALEAIC